MGLIDIGLGIGDIFDIGRATHSAIRDASSKKIKNVELDGYVVENTRIIQGDNIVIKCPGCGHKSAIKNGDGIEDRCEYCGTVIGN